MVGLGDSGFGGFGVFVYLGLGADAWFIDAATWSPRISELVEMGTIGLRPYQLMLGYDDWSYGRYSLVCFGLVLFVASC